MEEILRLRIALMSSLGVIKIWSNCLRIKAAVLIMKWNILRYGRRLMRFKRNYKRVNHMRERCIWSIKGGVRVYHLLSIIKFNKVLNFHKNIILLFIEVEGHLWLATKEPILIYLKMDFLIMLMYIKSI